MYKNRLDYERAVTYGNYDLPQFFPEDSPYRKYAGTALGSKLRIHPISAILAKIQLKHLVERNAAGRAQMKRLNDRLVQLPGLTIPYVRPDCQRVYYWGDMLFLDSAKAGMSREACIKALQAEGVQATAYSWRLLHTYPIFQEVQWWHHLPALPGKLTGSDEVNNTTIQLPFFTSEVPELIEQYAKAFEKVWAHRTQLS